MKERAFAALGIMPASICAAGRRYAHRPSTRSRAGRSSNERSGVRRRQAGEGQSRSPAILCRAWQHCHRRWGRRALPPPRCCAAGATAAALSCLSSDPAPPVDRPNLSKDYLRGSAPGAMAATALASYYDKAEIDLHLATEVVAIDAGSAGLDRKVGDVFQYDRLLLATGAEPVRLTVPGGDQAHVHTCDRSTIAGRKGADSRHQPASVVGARVHRTRGCRFPPQAQIAVHVVAPGEKLPMERALGASSAIS